MPSPTALVDAYKMKKEIKENAPSNSPTKIRTDEPYHCNLPKRYEHSQAAVLQRQQLPPKGQYTAPVKTITPVLRKLSSPESFPVAYNKIFDKSIRNVSGDYLADPAKASSLLKNTRSDDLNIKGRSTDYISEVKWRMALRN